MKTTFRYYFAALITLLSFLTGLGQNENILDLSKTQKYSDKAWKLKDSNPDSSYFYANKALEESRRFGQLKFEAYSLSDIARYHKKREEYDLAEKFLKESLLIRIKLGNQRDIISAFNLLGLLFRKQEKYELALDYFNKGLIQATEPSNKDLKAKFYDGIGVCWLRKGNPQEAFPYLETGLFLNRELDDSVAIAKSLQNMGRFYQKTFQSTIAEGYYLQALEVYESQNNVSGISDIQINLGGIYLLQGRFEKAKELFDESLALSLKYGLSENLPSIYHDLAQLSYEQGDLSRSLEMYMQELELGKQAGKKGTIVRASIRVAHVYNRQGRNSQAVEVLKGIESIIISPDLFSYREDYFREKSIALGRDGEYEGAFLAGMESVRLRDSVLASLQLARELSARAIRVSQELELKSKEEATKEALFEKERAQSTLKTGLILALLAILSTMLVAAFTRIRNKTLKIKMIEAEAQAEKDQNILERQILDTINQMERRASLLRIEAQKEEQHRISKDLHDKLGGNLATIQVLFDDIREKITFPQTQSTKYDMALELLDGVSEEVRRISHSMESQMLHELGLESAIEWYCNAISQGGKIHIEFRMVNPLPEISEGIREEVYTIFQNLIGNVLKHSQANRALVQIIPDEKELTLIVEDEGKGLASPVDEVEGFGIKSIRSRVSRMGGSCDFHSDPGNGTSVMVILPLN